MQKLLIFLILITCPAFTQVERISDSLLKAFEATDDPAVRLKVEESLITLMYTSPYDEARKLSDKLLKVSAGFSEKSLEIKVLIHSYRFHNFDEKIKLLNKAVNLINESSNKSILPHAYIFKAIAFRDNSMADSAMIYALKARDMLESNGKKEDLFAPMQLIADMHYYAGEYAEAKDRYLKIKNRFPEIDTNFNYRIIENNLGLVELGLGNYNAAEQHFLNSVAQLGRINAVYADSAGLPYIFRKLMETNLLKGDIDRADKFCDTGLTLAEYFKTFSEKPGLFTGKGVILFKRGELDASLGYLKNAEELEAKYPDLKNRIDLYKAFADTYTALGNFKDANKYLVLYSVERSRSDSLLNSSKIMYLLAEHNYVLAVKHISGLERERLLYIIILAILVFSMVILYFYYTRLKRANQILVEKNLKIAYSFTDAGPGSLPDVSPDGAEENENPKTGVEEKKQRDVDEEKLVKIATDLDHLVAEKKIYLDPDLTLVSLAEMLGTNRTYLVQAIKKKHGMNFLDFINGHRVAAAIRLLDTERAKSLSIDGIAGLAGFNNRVTFAKVFKQSTGMSPSIFMRSVSEMRKHSENEEASNSRDQEQ